MISPEELIEAWDKAAEPKALGLHDGAGFAMNNWELIREILKRLEYSR